MDLTALFRDNQHLSPHEMHRALVADGRDCDGLDLEFELAYGGGDDIIMDPVVACVSPAGNQLCIGKTFEGSWVLIETGQSKPEEMAEALRNLY